MITTIVSTQGRVVVPSEIRRRLNIKKGTRIHVTEREGTVILTPLTREYFEHMAGIVKTKKSFKKLLLAERAKDKKREEKKWAKNSRKKFLT